MKKDSWKFMVNTRAGGKLFTIKEGLNFDEMVQIVHVGINRLGNELELNYPLPESMLRDMPKDTPLVFVNNDRQWDFMCKMCKSMSLRLCILVKNGILGNHDQGFDPEDTAVYGKGHENKSKNVDRQDSNQELEVDQIFMMQSKSDKLLVVKCADTSCNWMVRGTKTNPTSEFFLVTKYIDKHTCFSRNIGGPRASSKVISKLLLENFGSAGLNMKP
ncbi:hypothetical protein F2Q69_00004648 [Brassica cretica]|uniref:Transposase MuDR plant domain-containing protein n=1 Tax=Brassica cretica TaxID=69181 RepID=A0A8S9NWE6_BRACR|nr:hypothetical protein F2Q69_00004648 [Brassica cretica]